MHARWIAAGLIVCTLVLTAWLMVGSFVTYAPSVTASDIQNIYIRRILWFGGGIVLFQFAALIALIIAGKPRNNDKPQR